MGCCVSGADKDMEDKKWIENNLPTARLDNYMAAIDRVQKFEQALPLSQTKIEVLEQKVRGKESEKDSLKISELAEAFQDEPAWKDLSDEQSALCQILKSPYFQDKQNPEEVNKNTLILWGLILCKGDAKQKVKVFYDVLQDNQQVYISASDKDFKPTFERLINLATKMPYQYEPLTSNQTQLKPQEELDRINGLYEDLLEKFLDDVYGAKSKLTRADWESKVALSQKWLFSAKALRNNVEKMLRDKDPQDGSTMNSVN